LADFPKITTTTDDTRAFARILRAALKHDVVHVPLDIAPAGPAPHLLHVVLTGEQARAVWILAEPVAGDGLRVKPRSQTQAAQLFALAQLGGPTSEMPPEYIADEATRIVNSQAPAFHTGIDPAFARAPRPAKLPRLEMPEQTMPTIAQQTDPMFGRTIGGRYLIEGFLGRGSAGSVYRGTHIGLGRDVAIKILHATNRAEPRFVKRFEAEAKSASRIEHAHVTRVIDFGEEPDGLLYLVMEFVGGRSLETLLAQGERFTVARAIDIGIQVASALTRAHGEGIIHRDIKPENIMLVRQTDDDDQEPIEIVKVCDFGVAKLVDPEGGLQGELTLAGALLGSPLYMAPEQIRNEKLDPRCDVYALGITLYEITVGRAPFEAETVERILAMQVFEQPPAPSSFIRGYDPAFEAIVMRMIAKKAEDRPTARALRAQLRELAITSRRDVPRSAPR